MDSQLSRTCNETRVVRSEILVPRHMNDKDTYYGGDMMAHFDSAGGGAVYKFVRKPSFTASVDSFAFLKPAKRGESVYIESFVTGAGKTSVEVFVKLISTDLKTWENKLCAYAFLTYVLEDREDSSFQMPTLIAESEEEKAIVAGYQERRKQNLEKREASKQFMNHISLLPAWEQ